MDWHCNVPRAALIVLRSLNRRKTLEFMRYFYHGAAWVKINALPRERARLCSLTLPVCLSYSCLSRSHIRNESIIGAYRGWNDMADLHMCAAGTICRCDAARHGVYWSELTSLPFNCVCTDVCRRICVCAHSWDYYFMGRCSLGSPLDVFFNRLN